MTVWCEPIAALCPKPKPKGRTEAQKLRRKQLEQLPEHKAKVKAYRQTPEYKEIRRRWLKTEIGRKYNAAATKRWRDKKRREAQ